MTTSIYDAAEHVLKHFKNGISTMKLQKLLYFAQGWSLALRGMPLFPEDFEAWSSGPANRGLFELLKGEYTVTADSFRMKLRERMEAEQRAAALTSNT